jgi:eukaryotic-like serine/threonine-protein kinase
MIPQLKGKEFEVIEYLTKTNRSFLYKGSQKGKRERVVIKLPVGYPENLVDAAKQESRLHGMVESSYVVDKVADDETVDGKPVLITRFIDGTLLKDVNAWRSSMTLPRVGAFLVQFAYALRDIHESGVVHKDVSPANAIVVGDYLDILDFGISVERGATEFYTEGNFGNPFYMAPETITGEVVGGIESDVYSLGCTLYEVLTAHPPFTGRTHESIANRQVTNSPVLPRARNSCLPDTPEELDRLCLDMLEKKPEKRPTTLEIRQREIEIIPGTRELLQEIGVST